MKSEKVFFSLKFFIVLYRVIQFYRNVGVRLNGGGEGIAEAPRSVWRIRSCEYFMKKIGAEVAHYPFFLRN